MKKIATLLVCTFIYFSASAQCTAWISDTPVTRTVTFYNSSFPPSSYAHAYAHWTIKVPPSIVDTNNNIDSFTYAFPSTGSDFVVSLTMTYTNSSGGIVCKDSTSQTLFPKPTGPATILGDIFRDSTVDTAYTTHLPNDNIKIWLISDDSSTHMISAVDSTQVSGWQSRISYSFSNVTPGHYLLKAATSTKTGKGFVPTYYASALHWDSASVLIADTGMTLYGVAIAMQFGAATSGPGFIAGDVRYGAGKGTAYGDPYKGMTIYLNNNASGKIIASTTTDDSGKYSFDVPYGSYTIYPDVTGLVATPWTNITVSSSAASQPKINFVATSKTITPGTLAIGNTSMFISKPAIYPNPSSGWINIKWNGFAKNNADIAIFDLSGKQVYYSSTYIKNDYSTLDIKSLRPGIYDLYIRSSGNRYTQKITVK
jgi:hypothetical protein